MTRVEGSCSNCGDHVTKETGWMNFLEEKYCLKPQCVEACFNEILEVRKMWAPTEWSL